MAFSGERINKVVRYSQVFDFEFRAGQVKVMISKELTAFPVKNNRVKYRLWCGRLSKIQLQ